MIFASSRLFLVGLCILGLTSTVQANLIQNGSFESGQFIDNGSIDSTMKLFGGDTAIDHWTVTGDQIAWIGPGYPWNIPATIDGNYQLDLTSYSRAGSGGISQTISTTIGSSYQLSFELGSNSVDLSSILVSIGGTAIQSLSFTGLSNQWDTQSIHFTAGTSHTDISFTGIGTQYNGHFIGLDNVVVVASDGPVDVVEPNGLALIGLGLALFGYIRAKKAA